jgi:flagellar biosynthesis protein FlhA
LCAGCYCGIIWSGQIFGGLIFGVFQQGMPLSLRLPTIHADVREGWGPIPALIISTAAGIIVTRSADENNFGSE